MIEYRQYEKSCDEDGLGKRPFRELPVGVRQQDAPRKPITSEPGFRVLRTRFPRLPALRDSACQSVKRQRKLQFEWYRGYAFTRLKKFS